MLNLVLRNAGLEQRREANQQRSLVLWTQDPGLLVRHLVLPEDLGGTSRLARFLKNEVSPDTWVNVLGSYTPPAHLRDSPPLDRRTTRDEYLEAVRAVRGAGLKLLGEDSGP